MAFSQGISGLAVAASNLDAIGNNIANSGTFGYKASSVSFQSVFAGAQVGIGASVAGVAQNFSAGSVQNTNRPLDIAITSGSGFFRVVSESGEIGYSRNGQFNVDKNGYIVSSAGFRLTGRGVTANGGLAGGTPTPLVVPSASMSPKATASIVSQFNFDSRSEAIPAGKTFSATDNTSYNYSNSLTVYDSQGKSHELALFFVKTGDNTWNIQATSDGDPVNAGAAVANLVFDAQGKLTTPADGKFTIAGLQIAGGAAPLDLAINLEGSTQYGNLNSVVKMTQDGYSSGTMTSFNITADGVITAKYSNEQTSLLGQIVLATFMNPNGLKPKDSNVWAETSDSGQPLIGNPGAGTREGALVAGSLEASNVDLTSELVNLIVAQRNYQANTQTLKTQDQIMQALMNMR